MAKHLIFLTSLLISCVTAQLSQDLSLHSENLVRMFRDYLLSDEQHFQLLRDTREVQFNENPGVIRRDAPVSYRVQNFAMWYEPGSGMRFCETNQSAVFEQCIDTSSNCQYLSATLQICNKPVAAKNLGCIKTCRLCNDKCATGEHNCHKLADCNPTPEGFLCTCKKGYKGDGVTSCTDVDECKTNQHNCLGNQICKNNIGGYDCATKTTKVLPSNNPCANGYTRKNGKCEDVDECSDSKLNACDKNAACTNTVGSYTCRCNLGYFGSGSFCKDDNECTSGTHNCDLKTSTCQNTVGKYRCVCRNGYKDSAGKCADVDECKGKHGCSSSAKCVNTIGSYRCQCLAGYRGNGFACQDVDECSKGERNFCNKLASCTNSVGSYSCTCPKGYYGSGFYCHDKNECLRRSDNNCHSRAKCTNTPGSFKCSCLSGYTGDGVGSCSRKQKVTWNWWG